jgi:hypothetical protein
MMKFKANVFLLILFFSFVFVRSRADSVEISGIILAKSYEGSSVLSVKSNWFIVIIDGDNTRIKAGPMGDPRISYFEYGLLGPDSYTLIHYTENSLVSTNSKNHPETQTIKIDGVTVKAESVKSTNNLIEAGIYVNNGRIPEYGLGLLNQVWLAYCFHLDLNQVETNHILLTPILSVGDDFRDYGGMADVKYTLNSSPPHFLQNLVEFVAKDKFNNYNLTPPAEYIFTNALFSVISWTNVENLAVPKFFSITNNYIDGSAWTVYEGLTENVSFNLSSLDSFKIPLITRVFERRKSVVSPLNKFSYTTTNGILMSRAKVEVNQHFRNELKEMQGLPSQMNSGEHSKKKLFIFAIFITLTALPLILIWKLKKLK